MSKIFEALQFAHAERIELDKLARQVSTEPKGDTQVLTPEPVPEVTTEKAERLACNDTQALSPRAVPEVTTDLAERLACNDTQTLGPAPVPEIRTERAELTACNCEERSYRIRRDGVWDFLMGFLGLYPWKCSQCHRHFHRSLRY